MTGEESSSKSRGPFIAMGIFLVVIAAGAWFGRGLSNPTEETSRRLEDAKAAVIAFAKERGEAPESLEELVAGGFVEELPVNRGGHALVYTRLGDGDFELKSLGPDGKEGGFMFKRDHSIRFQLPAE